MGLGLGLGLGLGIGGGIALDARLDAHVAALAEGRPPAVPHLPVGQPRYGGGVDAIAHEQYGVVDAGVVAASATEHAARVAAEGRVDLVRVGVGVGVRVRVKGEW